MKRSIGAIIFSVHQCSRYQPNLTYCDQPLDVKEKFNLFPLTNPYRTGYLQVSDIHHLYYHLYGNPDGKPVLVIHGGPGGSSKPAMSTYFDPKAYNIVLVDQRGCGKSTPFAEIRENTTLNLAQDFEKLRNKLGIERWQLFGGSWGSTLALTYAINYPERVSEMILRGIFLGRQKEIEWMYEGKGANYIFPSEWEIFESFIPDKEKNDLVEAYRKRLNGEYGEQVMLEACYRWAYWESQIARMTQSNPTEVNRAFDLTEAKKYLPVARLENHYAKNRIFFPRDGYLLEKENLQKIEHIPIIIIQGRYDTVCPPISAYELHKSLPHSKLIYTLSGHSANEPEIVHQLVQATENFKTYK